MSTENCRFRIPLTQDDEMVLVPAKDDEMVKGEVVAGPQNGGIK